MGHESANHACCALQSQNATQYSVTCHAMSVYDVGIQHLYSAFRSRTLTLWRQPLPHGYSYEASCAIRPG